MKKEICENCKFFNKFENMPFLENEEGEGECRINPPIIFKGDTTFPKTMKKDWCGKFQEKK